MINSIRCIIYNIRLPISRTMSTSKQIVIDPFCSKAFTDPTYAGYLNTDPAEFENQLNQLFEDEGRPLGKRESEREIEEDCYTFSYKFNHTINFSFDIYPFFKFHGTLNLSFDIYSFFNPFLNYRHLNSRWVCTIL